jgi:hypothetical protein
MEENIKNEKNTLKKIFRIDSNIRSNNNLIFQSRQMIEENRSMILNNYTSAFSGNNRLANANTEEVFKNRNSILTKIKVNNETEKKFVDAEKNKANIDFLEHQSNLNSVNLEISKEMAEINSKLIEINRKIMQTNESIVSFNSSQLKHNQNLLKKKIDVSDINEKGNNSIIKENNDKIENLENNEKINQEELHKLLNKSKENSNSLINNKKEILERRNAIMTNTETISINKSKIFFSS